MLYVYVLKLQKDKWYVGRTNDIEKRLNDHFFLGSGLTIPSGRTEWTKKYPPINVESTYEINDTLEEDLYVKKYMRMYGIDNVRGGSYSLIHLSQDVIISLKREFQRPEEVVHKTNDECFQCGKKGHFIKNCPKNKKEIYKKYDNYICYTCGEKGHFSNNCPKNSDAEDIKSIKEYFKKLFACCTGEYTKNFNGSKETSSDSEKERIIKD